MMSLPDAILAQISEAFDQDDPSILEPLISEGAISINQAASAKQNTLLHAAAYWGKANITDFLLENGADPNLENSHGRTPLFAAAKKGHRDIVERLIHEGAAVNHCARNGNTPLHWAIYKQHLSIANTLVLAGARFDVPNADNVTAFELANDDEQKLLRCWTLEKRHIDRLLNKETKTYPSKEESAPDSAHSPLLNKKDDTKLKNNTKAKKKSLFQMKAIGVASSSALLLSGTVSIILGSFFWPGLILLGLIMLAAGVASMLDILLTSNKISATEKETAAIKKDTLVHQEKKALLSASHQASDPSHGDEAENDSQLKAKAFYLTPLGKEMLDQALQSSAKDAQSETSMLSIDEEASQTSSPQLS